MLANLNCGRTYPSEVARRIGVTRQAVYKMLKNLEKKEIVSLELDTERRNSKTIVITPKGEELIRAAVGILKEIEGELQARLPPGSVEQLRAVLEQDWGEP
ncbi:MAG: winged helix-turn-helix transcriptional regulator [Opitutales bacterium]|nr:winged helix-turn-helix transcriptional regulator [Opitutales bacterium]